MHLDFKPQNLIYVKIDDKAVKKEDHPLELVRKLEQQLLEKHYPKEKEQRDQEGPSKMPENQPNHPKFAHPQPSAIQVMKAIDFGTAQWIDGPPGSKGNHANMCTVIDGGPLTTDPYESPEHWAQCYTTITMGNKKLRLSLAEEKMELSAKSDIWAIGVIIHEIGMMDPESGLDVSFILIRLIDFIYLFLFIYFLALVQFMRPMATYASNHNLCVQ
jgi:serine/threonine protein kinase